MGREKTKKGLNIVKRYFMTGKFPDWRKVNASWNYEDTHGRHLDLFSLLYCHPVQDYQVLKPLRDAYLAGEAVGRERRDVFAGCHTFLALALRDASSNGREYGASRKHFVCDVEMMLRLLFEDALDDKQSGSALGVSFRNGPNIYGFSFVEKWLELDKLNAYGQRMLLQHDLALELMYANVCALEGRDRRTLFVGHTGARWERIFYGLHHYDFKKEGETIRAEVVAKLTHMLDEREWIPEVKQIWERVKQDDNYGRGLDKASNDPLQLDLSFWKPKNKTWLAQRETQWPHMEKLLKLTKKQDGLAHCKAYFLKGKLPNWREASQMWEGGSRVGGHVDLLSLLLLHPSGDYAVLQPLRDQYLSGRWYGRRGLDLLAGFDLFKNLGFRCPCENGQKPGTKPKKNGGPYSLGEKTEVLTRLFYDIIDQPFSDDDLRAEYRHTTHVDFDFMRRRDYTEELVRIAEWLRIESLSDAGGRIIYQYEIAASHLIQALRLKLTDRDFIGYRRGWQTILYRLYRFDTHTKAPDVARTTVARRLCEAFDEPGWPKIMGEIRDDIKANKLQVENPWGQAFKWR